MKPIKFFVRPFLPTFFKLHSLQFVMQVFGFGINALSPSPCQENPDDIFQTLESSLQSQIGQAEQYSPWLKWPLSCQYTLSELLVGWSDGFRNPLPSHLSDVGLGRAVSDHFCNFPKPTIQHSHPPFHPYTATFGAFHENNTECQPKETCLKMCAVIPIF